MGLSHLKSDSRFNSNSSRVGNREEIIRILSQELLKKSCDEWIEAFDGCKFPYGPVNDLHNAFNDPQVPSTVSLI
jgi:succinate--hydroxymethylglutarate CoA-transferase